MKKNTPDFLIIGAMKAGSSTLYWDLNEHPGVFMPDEKEPHTLLKTDLSHTFEEYDGLFSSAPIGRLCGEASTGYSKFPAHENIAERARRVMGGDGKVLYIVRNPIDRAISHHHYLYSRYKDRDIDFNEDLLLREEYIHYGLYFTQIKLWIDIFGKDNVKVITLDRYVENRQSTYHEVCDFLGIERVGVLKNSVSNSTAELVSILPILQRFTDSTLYKDSIRPLFMRSKNSRESSLSWVRSLLRRKINVTFPDVSPSSRKLIHKACVNDLKQLLQVVNENDSLYVQKWIDDE